jgi:hypothetical protein
MVQCWQIQKATVYLVRSEAVCDRRFAELNIVCEAKSRVADPLRAKVNSYFY